MKRSLPDPLQPQGPWEARRHLVLADLTPENRAAAESCLAALPGVRAVLADPARQRLSVRYDPCQILCRDLLAALSAAGHTISASWWQRCRHDWFDYLDRNARINARPPPPPCCNKPPR